MRWAFSEGAVTRLRREFKLVLPPRQAELLCARLVADEGRPSVATRITSVYFDHPDGQLAKRAQATPQHCLKVRTKEYDPDLDADAPRVVLEAKREQGGLTRKERVWIARSDLGAVFRRPGLGSVLPGLGRRAFVPVLAVTYVREVYQREESWRVTVDKEVRFHAVSPTLALGHSPLTLDRLPAALGEERRVVVEVKHLGDSLPRWLEVLGRRGALPFSKFAAGLWCLHGGRWEGASGGGSGVH